MVEDWAEAVTFWWRCEMLGRAIVLALGGNIGDRLAFLTRAYEAMGDITQNRISSSIYETPPWGYLDQAPFLNAVVLADTGLSPHELLGRFKEIETGLGRQPQVRYGPR